MYKWRIDILLKSGREISGVYEGKENNSLDVGQELLANDPSVTIFVLGSLDGTAQLFINRSEVATMAISIFHENIDN